MNLFILAVEAVMMLFMFRALLQSSNADYYHPVTQSVIKLTNFAVNIPVLSSFKVGNLYLAGFFVAYIVSLVFWLVFGVYFFKLPINAALLLSLLTLVKAFGYLLLCLLIIQALCSWLDSTRAISYYLGQVTYIFVAPIQKIIPPIGMIDISLMIFMLAIFFLNSLLRSLFGVLWMII